MLRNPTDYELTTQEKLRGHRNISHDTSQYIDNSTNSIGGDSISGLINYTEDFFKLLKRFYLVNRLKLNDSKTMLMMIGTNYKTKDKDESS